ncbi:MAG: DUF3553 domain-containing protein [Phycisphaerales bacterium]|nr:DUF3553 domain-containing protein [Phycisphaerales bacterium]
MSGVSPTSEAPWSFGDRVRLPGKPEWGVGVITAAKPTTVRGAPCWSLQVRFPNAGIKSLNSSAATLERVEETPREHGAGGAAAVLEEAAATAGDELLGPMAQRRVEALMVDLPEACQDPFRSLAARVETTLALYRFDATGGRLIDWAVAQTGLNDPMTHFNRQELETHFRKWAQARDQHLARLVRDARHAGESIDRVLAAGPQSARVALSRTRIRG